MTALMRWDPFRDLVDLQRDVSRLFADFGTMPRRREIAPMMMTPIVDVLHRGEDLVIRAEMPGIKPEDLDISIAQGILTLKAERHEDTETREEDYLLRESTYGSFERSMRLPEGVEPETIHAEYHDGILEITLPHARELTEPHTVHIPIESHSPAESKRIETHH